MQQLSRRHFLKVQGATLFLPFMPSVAQGAAAKVEEATPSKKLMLMYIPNGIVRRGFFPGEASAELPAFVGGFNADKTKKEKRVDNVTGVYPLEFTPTMEPLREHADDITMITGLERSYKNGPVSYTHLTLPTICSV